MENSLFPISISQVERTDPINAMEVSKFCVPSTFRQDMQVRAVFRVLCDFGVACQSGPGGRIRSAGLPKMEEFAAKRRGVVSVVLRSRDSMA